MSDKLSADPSTANVRASGDELVLARRYANALYSLAEQARALDPVSADLRLLAQLWQDSTEWRQIACDPRLSAEKTVVSVAKVASTYQLSELTSKFLAVLAQNRRLSILPQTIECFLTTVATGRGEYCAEIRAAQPLSPAQSGLLASLLGDATGGRVRLSITEDPALLGGLTVKMGSKFVDASVKTKLEKLERQLKAGAVA